MIYEILRAGRENAITAQSIMIETGLENERQVRKQIAIERQAGKVILSSVSAPGGYYLPRDAAEVRRFIRTLENHGKSTLAAIQSARRYLEQIEGQQDLMFDDEQQDEQNPL